MKKIHIGATIIPIYSSYEPSVLRADFVLKTDSGAKDGVQLDYVYEYVSRSTLL